MLVVKAVTKPMSEVCRLAASLEFWWPMWLLVQQKVSAFGIWDTVMRRGGWIKDRIRDGATENVGLISGRWPTNPLSFGDIW